MKKKLIALFSAVTVLSSTGMLAACGDGSDHDLTIAFLAGGRGETYVGALVEAFEQTTWAQEYLTANEKESLDVEIISGGGGVIEDSVRNAINSDNTPDVLFLNYNMQNSTTEAFVRARQLVDLTDLLEENVYGEETTLGDKLVPGLLSNYTTQPYGDGHTYTLPAFYSPTGLWYDASRFYDDGKGDEYTPAGTGENEGKYELPKTWAEFWALGDYLNTQNGNLSSVTGNTPALFTYPTAGYFDGFIYSAVAGMAGTDKFMQMLGYADGIWEDEDVQDALEIVVRLKDYLEPNTVAQANTDGFQQNQQAVIGSADGTTKGTALFVPNGDWLPGEMANSTPEGYEWGFMPLPSKDDNTMSYVNTYLENVYLHTDGSNIDLAKQFLLFYYSDQGAAIVAREASAIIPTQDALENAKANGISDSTIDLYNAYDGNGAVSGSFAATNTVTGVIWNDVLYNDLNTNVFGATTGSTAELLAAWTKRLESASDQYRAQIIK